MAETETRIPAKNTLPLLDSRGSAGGFRVNRDGVAGEGSLGKLNAGETGCATEKFG